MSISNYPIPEQIEQRAVAARPSAAGFRRPVAHVLFGAPEAWSIERLRSRYRSWFWGEASSWRDDYDARERRLYVELDGFAFLCRPVDEPWGARRIEREIGGLGPGTSAAAAGDINRARVTISPDVSLTQWVAAPQAARRGALDALVRLVAANAALEGA